MQFSQERPESPEEQFYEVNDHVPSEKSRGGGTVRKEVIVYRYIEDGKVVNEEVKV